MAAPVLVRVALALALALITSCTEDCGRSAPGTGTGRGSGRAGDGPEMDAGVSGARRPRAPMSARLVGLPAAQAVWHASIPGRPGLALIEHGVGPVLVPGEGERTAMVVIGSSAIGFAAVDAESGALRWQRWGEEAPEQPLAAPNGHLWLPGRCMAHVAAARDATEAPAADAAVLGCVDVVEHAGNLIRRVWLHLEAHDGGDAVAVRGRRGRVLGRMGERLLWAYGPDVLAFDMNLGQLAQVYRAGESIEGDVLGWVGAEPGPELASASVSALESGPASASALHSGLMASTPIIATSDALMGFDMFAPSFAAPLLWHIRVPRSVGVAGPVHTAGGLAWVRDNELQAAFEKSASPAIRWIADEYHSYAPGSLIALEHDRLLALSMADGIHPVIRDAITGRLLHRGQATPGIQVLAATPTAGGLAAVVRLDRTLRRDVVIAWDMDLRIAWAWPLPAPPHPRIAPVGLAASRRDVLVFYDGRHAVRLSAP